MRIETKEKRREEEEGISFFELFIKPADIRPASWHHNYIPQLHIPETIIGS